MVEVMTDKATVVIPSPRKGRVLKLHGKEGESAKVHHPLVTLDLEGAAPADQSEKAPAAAKAAAPAGNGHGTSNGSKVLATPVTRRIAREHGVNLSDVQGSGPGGRVLKTDVMRLVEQPTAGAVAIGTAVPLREAPKAPLKPQAGDQRIPLKGLRRAIAKKMVESKFTAPHYTFVEEVDFTELKALRRRLNDKLKEAEDTLQISFLPFIAKALTAAFRKFPQLNANFDEAAQELVVRSSINLGIAVATEDGLVVPVVKGVEAKSLRTLAEEIVALAGAAREKRARPEDLSGGTFTITSLGEQGGLFATPIINHPEVAILGVHKMRPRPVVKDGQIVVRDMGYLSLSFDHRVIDGAVGAAFTYEVIRTLESPELLLLDLS
jgi:pyruvate dehydrogenase E2 component (dihydrolipoamide acetyltransferase)